MRAGQNILFVSLLSFSLWYPCNVHAQPGWRHTVDSLVARAAQSPHDDGKAHLYASASDAALQNDITLSNTLAATALEYAKRSGADSTLTLAYVALSNNQLIKNNTDSVLDYALQGLAHANKTTISPDIYASLFRKLAFAYRNTGRYQAGINASEQAIRYSTLTGNTLDICHTCMNVGQLFDLTGKTDSAKYFYNKGLALAYQLKNSDAILRIDLTLAKLYERRKNPQPAYRYYLDAEKWTDSATTSLRSRALLHENFAAFLIRYGHVLNVDPDEAARYLAMTRELTPVNGETDDNLMDYHLNMALLNMRAHKEAEATEELQQYEAIRDTLQNQLTRGHAQKLQAVYETAQKEARIQALQQQNTYNRRIVWLLAGILALLSVSLTLLWLQKRRITRQQQRLSWLMRELHHRVKNNLQIVSSLLNIQTMRIADADVQHALREGQHRIEAMSLIHQKLYQGKGITTINIKHYLVDLAESLMRSYGFSHDSFDLNINVQVEEVDVDEAIPMGLIINEVLTNAFKYAYHGVVHPQLLVTMKLDKDLQLSIADNGSGIDLQRWKSSPSFGKRLIVALTKQLKGEMTLDNKAGTTFTFTFPYRQRSAA